jgi:hypothetical protein
MALLKPYCLFFTTYHSQFFIQRIRIIIIPRIEILFIDFITKLHFDANMKINFLNESKNLTKFKNFNIKHTIGKELN